MAIRTVLQLGDPGLREVAKKVDDPAAAEIRALVEDLSDTLAYWRKTTGYGRGIAARRLARTCELFFCGYRARKPWPVVNPVITERSKEKIVVWDACLSFFPFLCKSSGTVKSPCGYQDLNGERHEVHANEERNLSSCCSTKSITWMGSSRWIASRT